MRLVLVTYGSSIHTARWVSQLADQQWDVHLVPADEQRLLRLHPDLRNITVHSLFTADAAPIHSSVRHVGLPWPSAMRGRGPIRKMLNALPGQPMSSERRLERVIRSVKPHVVHSMDVDGGILTLAAREKMNGRFPPWMHSSWGSDFNYFGREPEYARQIHQMLGSCDYLLADCQRELELAPSFGFKGEILGVIPGAGGYRIRHMQQFRSSRPPSSRRLIMLKGRQGDLGGRALVALQALHASAAYLSKYEIAIYIADDVVAGAAEHVARQTRLNFIVVPLRTPHDDMMRLMGSARVAIGVGMTDGTPQAMLEAMVMGAFPIQSDTADTRGWIENGTNGFVVPPENAEGIARAIQMAVLDDRLVDDAAKINGRMVSERIDISLLKPRVIAFYKTVAQRSGMAM